MCIDIHITKSCTRTSVSCHLFCSKKVANLPTPVNLALYTKPGMNQKIDDLKRSLLSTDYPRWRNTISSVFLISLCTIIVGLFFYLYLTTPLLQCYEGYLYFAIIWLICEYIVIIYLYAYNNIPSFARTTIKMVIGLSNIWFGLFIFGLQACVV